MTDQHELAAWFGDIELRAEADGTRRILGSFPLGADVEPAVIASRGVVRKERFLSGSMTWSVEEAEAGRREISLLKGHKPDWTLATTRNKTLRLAVSATALSFEAILSPAVQAVRHVQDVMNEITADLLPNVSVGFTIPPSDIAPNAVQLTDDSEPGVKIRNIAQATIWEVSLVARGSYKQSSVSVRGEIDRRPLPQTGRKLSADAWAMP